METLSIDQSEPLPVRRPASVAELCDLVKQSRAAGQGVYPVGGRTTLDVGLPPIKPGIALDTTALNQVIDYPARDMTITVQAGITVAALQRELEQEGQWLPVDVASPEKATLGGAIALNQSGPRRYGYGTLRDYVIGISFVTDDGVQVKAGGRVVKNVAGYDLMKLQIGGVGTLGVVTQVTLKVKPRPEASSAVVFGCDGHALAAVLDLLHGSKSRPVAVELLNATAWRAGGREPPGESPWVLAVGFEEKATTVAWQCETLLGELKAAPVSQVTTIPDAAGLWSAITQLQLRPESKAIGKTSVLPSKAASHAQETASVTPGMLIHAHAMNGIIWTHHPDRPEPLAANMEQRAELLGEKVVVRRWPANLKKSLPIWAKPPAAWDLMRHVKKTLDPDNVFNPGRLFGDL